MLAPAGTCVSVDKPSESWSEAVAVEVQAMLCSVCVAAGTVVPGFAT